MKEPVRNPITGVLTSQSAVTTLARSLAEWAERPGNERFLRRDQEQFLADSLRDTHRRPQVRVAAWLLGTWHLGHGFAQVMNGNGRGFDEARIGQALRRCSLLLRQRAQQGNQRTARDALAFSLLQGALTALMGLALDDPAAEDLHDLLRGLPDAAFGAGDELPVFVRELLTLRAGERPVVTPRLGPYADVLLHWDGDQRLLGQKLAAMLDLHVEGTRGAGAPFDDPPSRLYPLDALAVLRVRDALGLPNPKVEHPLMFTNLGQMRPDPGWPRHDVVDQLERELRRR
jgi:hypothetical protein